MLKGKDPVIDQAVGALYNMDKDSRLREEARLREKRLHDEASALYDAEQRGLAEGRAEGEKIGLNRGRAEGEVIGLNRGRAEGRAEGELRMSFLVNTLLQNGRSEDLAMLGDRNKLESLYREYNL